MTEMLILLFTATKYKEYNALRDQIAGKTDNSEYPAKSKRRRDGQARVERERGSHGVEMAGRTSTPRRATRHVRRSEGSLGGQGGVVDAKEKEEEEREREEREGEQAFLATPSHARTMLGPTPQKDGVVLGLFDLLSPQQAERTPSRPRFTVAGMAGEGGTGGGFRGAVTSTPSRAPLRHLREVTGNSFPTAASATIYADKTATPRKHNGAFFDDDDITTADDKTADFVRVGRKTSRTPTSAGKRFLLDSFVTPRKRRRCGGDGGGGGEEWTPSSTARQFMTPQFLKREAPVMETLVEDDGFGLGGVGYGYDDDGNGDGDGDDGGKKKKGMGGLGRGVPSSRPRPWKRRSLGRSLSSMIQGMRKQEDERFDDEMAIMNDMESGGGGRENVVAKQKQNTADAATGTSDKERKTDVVPESQIGGSLDADGFHDIRKDDRLTGEGMKNTAVGRKKKGQKRQTRRVIRMSLMNYYIVLSYC